MEDRGSRDDAIFHLRSSTVWLPSLDLPYNAYFLSLKAYTEDGGPDWKDPADIHKQLYQFDVATDRLIHGLMRFDA